MDKLIDKHYTSGTKISSRRSSRAFSIVSLASSLAGNAFVESVNQISKGHKPQIKDLLITPANAKRVTDKLMNLRGAALKVGQLLSMDAGEFIPEELSAILSRLQDNVEPIPFSQLVKCLENEWGSDWSNDFRQFSFTPIAAASIGQVHTAYTHDDQKLALKVQYPNVDKSIDSDVDNVATLLHVTRLLPNNSNIKNLLEETKQQLKQETDYLQEARWLDFYYKALSDRPEFIVPKVSHDLTTKTILAMSYHSGTKIDQVIDLQQTEKDNIATLLIELLMKEMFEMKCVQTDPNLANYLYNKENNKIILLDFGAVRKLPNNVSQGYLNIMTSSLHEDIQGINAACEQIGFFQNDISKDQRELITGLFMAACKPLQYNEAYDFGNSCLATDISLKAKQFSLKDDHWHTPPADALFLHRKIAGIYLIAAKLKARVNVNHLFKKYL